MYKLMNDCIWKLEPQEDGTINIHMIEPDNPEYNTALEYINSQGSN
jgi:hypothetical protein